MKKNINQIRLENLRKMLEIKKAKEGRKEDSESYETNNDSYLPPYDRRIANARYAMKRLDRADTSK